MRDLDVIIPTFNAPASRLATAVAGALACDPTRVIVVDDGSASPPKIDLSPRAPAQVTMIRQANLGPSAARNAGLAASGAGTVVFLDDDDSLLPAGVRAQMDLVDHLGAVGGLGARIEEGDGQPARLRPAPEAWAGKVLPGPWEAFRPISLFGASGLMVTRRAIEAGLRFDPALVIGEDRDFIARLAKFGPVSVSAEPVLKVRLHDQNGSNLTSSRHMARRIRDHLLLLERHLDARSRDNFRESTRWLVKASARSGAPEPEWAALLCACRTLALRVPLRARARRWLTGR